MGIYMDSFDFDPGISQNDLDMFEVGNGLTVSEDSGHFSTWCMLEAPLFAGNSLLKLTKETVVILTNKDARGIRAYKYKTPDSGEVWIRPLKSGGVAV